MKISNPNGIFGKKTAQAAAVITGANYRISLLTQRLVRLEYSETGTFTDDFTQTVVNRHFPLPEYSVIKDTPEMLEVRTPYLRLVYNKREFSAHGLSIEVNGGLSDYRSTWHYGSTPDTLKGTLRTLDKISGAVPLEEGLVSKFGFALIDDSRAMLVEADGFVRPRENAQADLYFFGYGRDYLACLSDFFTLAGKTPLLPRYALGNWWSRFYKYSEQEYKQLIENFEKEKLPFSVAVMDMDWHLTDIDPKYGSGWTGYTWNRELFPNPAAFIGWLKEKKLKVTLNMHPAEGVRAFEEAYPAMAKALGAAPEREEKIEFNAADPDFLAAYFKYLHHPNEEMGVDFWWIDWQQQGGTRVEGIDPLWVLNHYHYLDNARHKDRFPLIFSRYAGFGSHRYPVGFSGDTYATWEMLDFQPYFTATASNAGYGWWSHDIGGHYHGIKDEELAVRWLQFGVFSPIMRYHSSNNPFFLKAPWHYGVAARQAMEYFLRLRHRLIPYLYTMNHRFAAENIPLICPMYYFNPNDEAAYHVPNQYWFGDSLIACPITTPVDKNTGLARFAAWLPAGRFYDMFSGRHYKGGRRLSLYRRVDEIPVLAKEGAIIPLCADEYTGNGTQNPQKLELLIFTGTSGSFTLREDNGAAGDACKEAKTHFVFKNGKAASFSLKMEADSADIVPEGRSFQLCFYGLAGLGEITTSPGVAFTTRMVENKTYIVLERLPQSDEVTFFIPNSGTAAENDWQGEAFRLLDFAQIDYDLKWNVMEIIEKGQNRLLLLGELEALNLPPALYGALSEIFTMQ